MTSRTERERNRRLRELATLAHERALDRALGQLFTHFQRWQARELDAFDLSHEVHRFHDKEGREIHSFHAVNTPVMVVVWALVQGLLSREEAGELHPDVQRCLAFLDAQRDEK